MISTLPNDVVSDLLNYNLKRAMRFWISNEKFNVMLLNQQESD